MFRCILFLLLLFNLALLKAQDEGDYAEQFEAIKSLIRKEKFEAARKQAEGLAQLGKSSLLTSVEAEAYLLIARSYLDDPDQNGRKRVNGIKALRESAKLFSQNRNAEAVERVLAELSELMGDKVDLTDLQEKVSSRKRKLKKGESLLIDKEILDALVATQEATIDALGKSQMRQMLELQHQRALLDSFSIAALEDSLLVVQQSMKIENQNAQLEVQRQQRNFFMLLGATALLVLGTLYWRFLASRRYQNVLKEKNENIELEKKRSDDLLLNILPAKVATELKLNGKAKAQRHPQVTVLFADFKGFSRLASDMDADEIVSILDEAFQGFDKIGKKYGVEKIKTIGDAYMAATGLTEDQPKHAERMVNAALEMQAFLKDHPYFSARIGIHTGPVVAGVVGLYKFAYDIWGDTVNRAARLESGGEIGQVNISAETKAQLSADQFTFESRGKVSVKNLGEIEMFFVRRRE